MSDSPVGPYQELGRHPGIRRAVQEFYERIAADPSLVEYFADADMDRLRRHVVELRAAAVGGPGQYTGRTMAKAHQGLHITDEAFDRVLGHLNAALVDVGADDRTIREVLRALSGMRMDIVQE
jgi:hemoglobin